MIMRTREQLMDAMIQLYGMESKVTINFCELCEDWAKNEWNDKVLNTVVKAHEALPLTAERLEAIEEALE